MPTYDYQCQSCDHEFELYQSITAKPIKVCPSCGRRRVVRLMGTGGGVIFKGSGFYQTDYRSEQYKQAAKSDSESTAGAATKKDAAAGPAATPPGDVKGGTAAKKAKKDD